MKAYSINKKDMINYPAKDLDTFYLYTFEWIDNLNFTLKPSDCLDNFEEYEEYASKKIFGSRMAWRWENRTNVDTTICISG